MIYDFFIPFLAGGLVSGAFFVLRSTTKKKSMRDLSSTILHEAELRAKEILQKAKQQADVASLAKEIQSQKKLLEAERQLVVQREQLKHREERLERERREFEQKQHLIQQQERRAQETQKDAERKLEALLGMSKKEAEATFIGAREEEIRHCLAQFSSRAIEQTRAQVDSEAMRLLQAALSRQASRITHDSGVEKIDRVNSESKGRIIGREGRNKKAFEDATGVTLIIDQRSDTVYLSSFDPERRHVAKEVLLELLQGNKIYPELIDELVQTKRKGLPQELVRLGREACQEAGVSGLHLEVLKLLGQLRFRLSVKQNVLAHSIEVSELMRGLALELGLDAGKAARMGLLHDIGKALPLCYGESHALAGAHFLRDHGESEAVCNGVSSHHDEVPAASFEAGLVKVADAISASKMGSRHVNHEVTFQRLRDLEQLAMQEAGVKRVFALESGKEVQVFVEPALINDSAAKQLAEKLFVKMNGEVQLPYPVKVSVIREQKLSV